jgi:hypothetical protein
VEIKRETFGRNEAVALATLLFTFIQARLKFRKAHPPSRQYLDQKFFVDTSTVDYGCIRVKIIWYKEVKIIAHLGRSSLNSSLISADLA